jgi:chaperonin GroES
MNGLRPRPAANRRRSGLVMASKPKIRPIGDKILVKRLSAEEKTAGGIVIPDTAKEKPKEGKVIALGDGKALEKGGRAPFQVKEGDRIVFTSYAGTEVKIDGEEYVVMSEDDILAVLE